MDFLSLSTEYNSREEHLLNVENTMTSFYNFFSSMQRSLYQYSTNTHNSLQNLFNVLMKYDNHSSNSKKIFDFYRLFEKHLTKVQAISNTFDTELVKPTVLITNHLKEKNINELSNLKKLISSTIEQKKKYEIAKHSYFDSCKKAEIQERKVSDSKNPIEEKKQHDILYKLRIEAEEESQRYKAEHKKTNDLYEENEKKYIPIVNNLRDNEESRINFISFHFEKFINYFEDFANSIQNVIKSLHESIVQVQTENDIKLYDEKFSFIYKNKERFLKEDYFTYDIYRRNIESIINKNKIFHNNGVPFPSIDPGYLSRSIDEIKLEQNDEIVYASLFSNVNMEKRYLIIFENKLKNDTTFAKKVVDKMLLLYKSRYSFRFDNFEKFTIFCDILKDVSMNQELQNNMFEINFALVFIAEKTYYQSKEDPNKKVYMTRLLSDSYQNFKSKEFWLKLIKYKISSLLDQKTIAFLNKENSKKKKDNQYGLVSLLFSSSSPSFTREEYEKTYENIKNKELFTIIKDFIHHFSNFSLDMSNSNDIIIEISNQFKLSNEQISFYISYLNSNIFSIKNKKLTDTTESNQTKKDFNYMNKQKVRRSNKRTLKELSILLTASINYLNFKDYLNLISLNKLFSTHGEKIIYKNLLLSDKTISLNLSFNNHIKIWYYLLKYNKKDFSYETILKLAQNYKSEVLDTIQLDVIRTPFDTDKEEYRKKLKNNLISLCYQYQNIGYIQGMNYISAFFLSMTKDEEEAFHLFSAFLSKTNYYSLLKNDFDGMKKYFYVFERLVFIYLPELCLILRKNNVQPSYYLAPWFITLYTNSYSTISDASNPKILIRIFDLFVLNGWNAILNLGLCLLKHFEEDIMKMKFEEMLTFLINDIVTKYDFFQSNNYQRFVDLYEKMKVPKGVISNLENEYEISKKILKINEKKEKILFEKENVTSI